MLHIESEKEEKIKNQKGKRLGMWVEVDVYLALVRL
jgi:hypothetical protein